MPASTPAFASATSATIVVLANARKYSARSMAGKHVSQAGFGTWVRPISARPGGGIAPAEQALRGGGQADVLDVVALPLAGPAPQGYQRENRFLALGDAWVRQGRLGWRHLCAAVDAPARLWLNGWHSRAGINDRLPVHAAGALSDSLSLIGPVAVNLVVEPNRVRTHFLYRGSVYNLAVTDPRIENDYKARACGTYRIDQAVLCLSLSEPFQGFAYKLVAALITPQRTENSE